jgi:type I restriction enzyme S subunit
MGSEWIDTTLGALSTDVSYGYTESASSEKVGPHFLRITDIQNGVVDWKTVPYCPIDEIKLDKYILEKGDIVVARTGNSTGENYIFTGCEETVFASYLIRFKIDSGKADPFFVWYNMRSPAWWNFVSSSKTGSAQAGANAKLLGLFPLKLPPLSQQKAIAHILGTLDGKIELNRQMNATLEAMAQALFKSWFVDFDPVIDNALAAGNPIPEELKARADARTALGDKRKPLPEGIQKQFPSRFVFTEEMGWVPEGWEVGQFKDLSNHVKDGIKAEDVGDYDFYVGLEHIGRKQIFLSENGTGESIGSNKTGFEANDLLFGKLRPYFHKVCVAPQEGICSTDILVFRPKKPVYQSYMYLTAFSEAFVEYANMRSTGTRMPRASAKDMLVYEIIVPPGPVLESFQAVTAPFWEKGKKAVESSRMLANLRDSLLPKLLSGELRIPDEEKQVGVV